MKTKYLLLVVMALGLLSCESIFPTGKIWDIAPVVFSVQVLDAGGVDLLNKDNPKSIDTSGIKALYRGVEYKCSNDLYALSTKAYAPQFYGLQLSRDVCTGVYILRFGELDGAKSYSNEELTIYWGDGSSDKIKFNRKFKWRFNGDPHSSEEWFLNDKKVLEGAIKIVR